MSVSLRHTPNPLKSLADQPMGPWIHPRSSNSTTITISELLTRWQTAQAIVRQEERYQIYPSSKSTMASTIQVKQASPLRINTWSRHTSQINLDSANTRQDKPNRHQLSTNSLKNPECTFQLNLITSKISNQWQPLLAPERQIKRQRQTKVRVSDRDQRHFFSGKL